MADDDDDGSDREAEADAEADESSFASRRVHCVDFPLRSTPSRTINAPRRIVLLGVGSAMEDSFSSTGENGGGKLRIYSPGDVLFFPL